MEHIDGEIVKVNEHLDKYILSYAKPNEYHSDFDYVKYDKVVEDMTRPIDFNNSSSASTNDWAYGTMFALGISDLNTYLKSDDRSSFEGQNIMLSSPGGSTNTVATIFRLKQNGQTELFNINTGARGAFFINLNQ